jgi:hypothetical protein
VNAAGIRVYEKDDLSTVYWNATDQLGHLDNVLVAEAG